MGFEYDPEDRTIMKKEDLKGFKPLPKDLRGWQGDSDIFEKLIHEVLPDHIIEVGSWKGQSTITMANACKARGLSTRITCIDTWLGAEEFYTNPSEDRDLMKNYGYPQVYYQFLSNLIHEDVVEMIEILPITSVIGAKLTDKADLIYIDGSHSYEDVRADIELYTHKLNMGGIIFGDDYNNGAFKGVKLAVDEFVAKTGYNLEIYNNWFWIIRKC